MGGRGSRRTMCSKTAERAGQEQLVTNPVPCYDVMTGRSRSAGPRAAVGEGVRLFLALDLPADARAEIGRWRDALLSDREKLRAVDDAALHVTLVFLGRRPREQVERVWEVAARLLEGLTAPRLTPVALKAVPPRRPRVVALDLEDERARGASLQRSLSSALQEAGLHGGLGTGAGSSAPVSPEARPFWPHITVARARGRARMDELVETPPPALAPFTARGVTLYRSDLHPEGARYVALERMELSEPDG